MISKGYQSILGALYGQAVGDAMGMPSELWPQRQVQTFFGWIDNFLPGPAENFAASEFVAGEFTDDTRPNSASGVSDCSSVDRMRTLTLSATPLSASSTTESVTLRDNPKPMMHSAKAPTARSSVAPARLNGGRCAR